MSAISAASRIRSIRSTIACGQRSWRTSITDAGAGAAEAGVAVVLNPGAWSHYSYAVRDACAALPGPLVEVHLSQTASREPFRHHSYLAAISVGQVVGLGPDGYRFALRYLIDRYTESEVAGG